MQAMKRKQVRCPGVLTPWACSLALLVTGCTYAISEGLDEQGNATQIIFPEITQNEALERGIFPNLDNLRLIKPGMTKEDLYYLLGVPHFRETHGAREWDYVFKFHDAEGVTTCQYKVLFDTAMKGRNFYWKPESCADRLSVQKDAIASAEPRRIRLKADALFPFGKFAEQDMRPAGRQQLDELATELKSLDSSARITITGHTDRLGSDAYNQRLSQQRAETVRGYLAARGVPGAQMSAQGMGEHQPVAECGGKMARKELIACLEPNRRVEIEVTGEKPLQKAAGKE